MVKNAIFIRNLVVKCNLWMKISNKMQRIDEKSERKLNFKKMSVLSAS